MIYSKLDSELTSSNVIKKFIKDGSKYYYSIKSTLFMIYTGVGVTIL